MTYGDTVWFALYHFWWTLQVSFLAALAMARVHTAGLVATFQFYSRSFFIILALDTFTESSIPHLHVDLSFRQTCQLGLFHAFTAFVFVHYLKMYFDFRSIKAVTGLRFYVELLGFVLLISTFFGTWSLALVFYFHFSAYSAQRSADDGL